MRSVRRIETDRVSFLVAVAIASLAVSVTVWRVSRGVDFTDEAFYLGLPYRFILGDRPFVDELNIAQTAGLILYPFLKAYVSFSGTNGIFLFVRYLYVAFFVGVGASAYGLARTRLPSHTALLAGVPCVAFIPYAIPSLSYNTLGVGLMSIGLFLMTRGLVVMNDREHRPRFFADPFLWAGFALGAASFSYASLVLGAFTATIVTLLLATGRRVLSTFRLVAGAVIFTALVAPSIVKAGGYNLGQVIAYSGGGGLGSIFTTERLGNMSYQFLGQHPELSPFLMLTAAAVALSKKWPRFTVVFLPLLPLVARGAIVGETSTTLAFVAALALIGPIVALALRDGHLALRLVAGVWLPSAICGLGMTVSSGNGTLASGLGLFPAAIVTTILLALWIRELGTSFPSPTFKVVFAFAPVVVASTMTKLELDDGYVYRDGAISTMTSLVTEGPYKGLWTTATKKAYLTGISADIRDFAMSDRMLFYYDFPAGYLVAQRRPLVNSAWIFAMDPRMTMDAERFKRDAKKGDVIFKVEAMDPESNPLDAAVVDRADKVSEKNAYTIWIVR